MVWVGEMAVDPELKLAWVPIPLSMLTLAAPATDHDKAAFWPDVMEAGEALNEEITGAAVAVQATVREGVMVTSVGLDATRVTYE